MSSWWIGKDRTALVEEAASRAAGIVPAVVTPPMVKAPKDRASRVQLGNCAWCGQPRGLYAYRCDACQRKWQAEQVRRTGRQWAPGKPGRPPRTRVA